MAAEKLVLPIALTEAEAKQWIHNALEKNHYLRECLLDLVRVGPKCAVKGCESVGTNCCQCPEDNMFCDMHYGAWDYDEVTKPFCWKCTPFRCYNCDKPTLFRCQSGKDPEQHFYCLEHQTRRTHHDDGTRVEQCAGCLPRYDSKQAAILRKKSSAN